MLPSPKLLMYNGTFCNLSQGRGEGGGMGVGCFKMRKMFLSKFTF